MDRSVGGDALHIRCRRRCLPIDKTVHARSMSSTEVDPTSHFTEHIRKSRLRKHPVRRPSSIGY